MLIKIILPEAKFQTRENLMRAGSQLGVVGGLFSDVGKLKVWRTGLLLFYQQCRLEVVVVARISLLLVCKRAVEV